MNNKLEQGKNWVNIVNFTSIKLNKSIDFLDNICYYKSSRETQIKTKNKRQINNMKKFKT